MEPAALLLFAASLLGAGGIQITHLNVPTEVRNGSSYTILDCVYSLKPDEVDTERGLVVKWYFNNGPFPVYQWIPGMKPQDLGVLRGRLNVLHRVTDNVATMHRALYILNPTTELSGEYKCHVSTFEDEDFMTKKMVVYATEKKFELTQSKPDPDSVRIACSAKGLFPEPKMALYKAPSGSKMSVPEVEVETTATQGSYDIRAHALLSDADLEAPTFFDCEVKIPEVRYAVRKTIVYYPGIYELPSAAAPSRPLGPTLPLLLLLLLLATAAAAAAAPSVLLLQLPSAC